MKGISMPHLDTSVTAETAYQILERPIRKEIARLVEELQYLSKITEKYNKTVKKRNDIQQALAALKTRYEAIDASADDKTATTSQTIQAWLETKLYNNSSIKSVLNQHRTGHFGNTTAWKNVKGTVIACYALQDWFDVIEKAIMAERTRLQSDVPTGHTSYPTLFQTNTQRKIERLNQVIADFRMYQNDNPHSYMTLNEVFNFKFGRHTTALSIKEALNQTRRWTVTETTSYKNVKKAVEQQVENWSKIPIHDSSVVVSRK